MQERLTKQQARIKAQAEHNKIVTNRIKQLEAEYSILVKKFNSLRPPDGQLELPESSNPEILQTIDDEETEENFQGTENKEDDRSSQASKDQEPRKKKKTQKLPPISITGDIGDKKKNMCRHYSRCIIQILLISLLATN